MLPIVDFFMKNIYCAAKQDSQFSFTLVKVNKQLARGSASVYNVTKRLPSTNLQYDVYALGNVSPGFLNLLRQEHDWYRDVWIRVSDDMMLRNYILHAYDSHGVMVNRSKIFYSFIDESSLIFAVERDAASAGTLLSDTEVTIHLYSNAYFKSAEFNMLPVSIGIDYTYVTVYNNVDKTALQSWVSSREGNGGKCFVFIDGVFYDQVSLAIPNGSKVEVIYDQSVVSKEYVPISSLRQFSSTKFGGTRYLLVRGKVLTDIEYYDDTEVYIATSGVANTRRGVFYFKHNANSMFMGTDKDYTFNSQYVNNLANYISTVMGGAVQDKQIILYVRKSAISRPLVYSDLRLHEFYKLPVAVQLNTLDGSGSNIAELRVEALEDSMYFRIASNANPFSVTKEMFMQALGYNSVSYYFGYNYVARGATLTIDVPELYQSPSTVYEYDVSGKMIGHHPTSGPNYICTSTAVAHLEFIKGMTPVVYRDYYPSECVVALAYPDYVVLSALFSGTTRLGDWEDITNTGKVNRTVADSITVTEQTNRKVAVIYLNEPNLYDLTLDLAQGFLYFPLTQYKYTDNTAGNTVVDMAYTNVEIFLNGFRLVQGVDYFMAYPYISICNKKYLDYSLAGQKVHVRAYGFSLDKTAVNALEIKGYVNNGVLARNNLHDIRDDRVMSCFVGGKFYPRSSLRYAEEDNTVRTADALNGLPYVMSEPFISIKQVSGLDTMDWYTSAKAKDKRIRDFFTEVLPEPDINEFNVIGQRHTLFSPVISKVIVDVVEGVIPATLYTNAYDDGDVIALLDANYKDLLMLDPVKMDLQSSLVEIHPHLGNTVISVNLYQYRFIVNVARIISSGRVNLSGYLSVTG